jgi:hypothetical protein
VADEGRAFAVRVIDGRTFSSTDATPPDEPAAYVLLGTRTLERRGRERVATFLRGGGRVLVTLGPDVDVATLGDTLGIALSVDAAPAGVPVTIVPLDARHPIFRPFVNPAGALGDVRVARYRRLNGMDAGSVLAQFSNGDVALAERPVQRGRLLVFASDLDNQWNRFPLNPGFVPWAVEMARYLVQGREVRQSFLLPDIPSGVAAEPGVHRAGERLVAVNPEVRESNPARQTLEEFTGNIVRQSASVAPAAQAEAREQEERQRLWQIGLLVMLIALAGEGLVARRAV